MEDEIRTELVTITSSLAALAGEKPGSTVKSWNKWWEKNRSDYLGEDETE